MAEFSDNRVAQADACARGRSIFADLIVWEYEYDTLNRLTKRQLINSGVLESSFAYSYDNDGELLREVLTNNESDTVSVKFYENGILKREQDGFIYGEPFSLEYFVVSN